MTTRAKVLCSFLLVCLWAVPAAAQDLPRLIATAVAGAPLQVGWTLAWDRSPDPAVTGYRAYCVPSSGSYSAPVTVTGTSYPVPFTGTFYCRVSSLAGSVEGPRSAELGIVNNVPLPPPPTPPPPPPPPQNKPPVVTMTAPQTGTVRAPYTTILKASAVDPDGEIVRVEFRGGAGIVYMDTTEPYEVSWGTTLPGIYAWTATAVDTGGASTTSLPVTVTVTAPAPPPPPTSPCAPRTGQVIVGTTAVVRETVTTATLSKRVAELIEAGWAVLGFPSSATVLAVCR